MREEGPITLATARLRLRPWRAEDQRPYAAMNADPRVREYFPKVLTAEESDREAARIAAHFQEHGFGFWALEAPGVADFAGFVGLAIPGFEAHFTPCVEIGWRLAFEHGYATEAARAAIDCGFQRLGLEEIVAFTVPANWRSRRVMERLGMTRSAADDFDHPRLSPGHPLRRHVLYRVRRCAEASTN